MNNLETELQVRDRQENIRAERENDRLVSRAPGIWNRRVLRSEALFKVVTKLHPTQSHLVKVPPSGLIRLGMSTIKRVLI
jgi:hypothetical protein